MSDLATLLEQALPPTPPLPDLVVIRRRAVRVRRRRYAARAGCLAVALGASVAVVAPLVGDGQTTIEVRSPQTGADITVLTGEEPLPAPLVLPDEDEHPVPVTDPDLGVEAFLQRGAPGIAGEQGACFKVRYLSEPHGTAHMCRKPEEWDSLGLSYSGEGDDWIVMGVVSPLITNLTFTFGDDEVVVHTVSVEGFPQARFVVARVPHPPPDAVEGSGPEAKLALESRSSPGPDR
jgi:hypothetical protein